MLTIAQQNRLRAMPLTRKPCDWSYATPIPAAKIEAIASIADIPTFKHEDLFHPGQSGTFDDFKCKTPTVFVLLAANACRYLINTEGYDYCRYVAEIV